MAKKLQTFLSGLAAFFLVFGVFTASASASELQENGVEEGSFDSGDVDLKDEVGLTDEVYADEDVSLPDDVYTDEDQSLRDDVYTGDGDTVIGDVYGDPNEDVVGDVYGNPNEDVVDDVYGNPNEDVVVDDVYGNPDEDVVVDDVYSDPNEDVVVDDVYSDPNEDVVVDDVYSDPNEDVVVDDVYKASPQIPINQLEDKNEVILDYTDKEDNQSLSVGFWGGLIDEVLSVNNNAKLVVQKSDISVALPAILLKSDSESFIEFSVTKKQLDDALSPVFEFTLVNTKSGSKITEFKDNPITLTFKVDPTKVTNWDDVKVVYINADGEKEEVLTPKSVNKETGEVTADVTHFSSYGVFEVASSNNEAPGDSDSNKDGEQPGSTDSDNSEGSDKESSEGVQNGGSDKGTNDKGTTKEGTDNKLPQTAGNDYNLLIAGLLLTVLSGAALLVYSRRMKKSVI